MYPVAHRVGWRAYLIRDEQPVMIAFGVDDFMATDKQMAQYLATRQVPKRIHAPSDTQIGIRYVHRME